MHAMVFHRETELRSETGDQFEIKVNREYALPGTYDGVIQIPRSGRRISATAFHDGSVLSNRGTTLKIFMNGVDSGKMLIPQDFVHYARLSFRVEHDKQNLPIVAVYGIKAKLTDFGLLNGLGFLLEKNRKDRSYEKII